MPKFENQSTKCLKADLSFFVLQSVSRLLLSNFSWVLTQWQEELCVLLSVLWVLWNFSLKSSTDDNVIMLFCAFSVVRSQFHDFLQWWKVIEYIYSRAVLSTDLKHLYFTWLFYFNVTFITLQREEFLIWQL